MSSRDADMEMVSMKQICQLLGISERCGWRWASEGRLPAPTIRAGRCTRWRAVDICRWLDQQKG